MLAGEPTLLNLLLESSKANLESKTEEGHTALWLALNSTSVSGNKFDENSIATLLVNAGASTSAVCLCFSN